MDRVWKFALIIATIIILDQLTKGVVQDRFFVGESVVVVKDFFSFTYVQNPGAAFGMGSDAAPFLRKFLFLFLPIIACFWLMWLIWTSRNKMFLTGLSYSLILAGAVGNLIDRFSYGYVVDFLDFYWKNNHFPAFNIADSAITVAAFLLIIDVYMERKQEQAQLESKPS